jgi:hypothetical protein
MFEGAALHAFDDLEVAAVQPIEVAECQDRVHEMRRPGVVREMDYLHDAYRLCGINIDVDC